MSDTPAREFDTSVSPVHIVDFDIPFGQMVWLLIKWTLAAIPALIALAMIAAIIGAVLSGLTSGR